jgi:hypothetical protein
MNKPVVYGPGMVHTFPARPMVGVSVNPELFCTKCEGAGEHEYSDINKTVGPRMKIYECLACAGTGIAPIPYCEASNGDL